MVFSSKLEICQRHCYKSSDNQENDEDNEQDAVYGVDPVTPNTGKYVVKFNIYCTERQESCHGHLRKCFPIPRQLRNLSGVFSGADGSLKLSLAILPCNPTQYQQWCCYQSPNKKYHHYCSKWQCCSGTIRDCNGIKKAESENGQPTRNQCLIPSSVSPLPNISAPTSPPAIAAVPRIIGSSPATSRPGETATGSGQDEGGLRPGTIAGIIVGDIAGVAVLGLVFFYVYHCLKKRRHVETNIKNEANIAKDSWSSSSSESRGFTRWACLHKRGENEEDSGSTSTDNEAGPLDHSQRHTDHHDQNKEGTLVTVDGEKELELESLLRASAYILGATGSSITYKAVLEDGTSFAVRRIGENHVARFRDFETQVRVIAKLVHPNLVRIRGFYWGVDEKLIIYDFVPNGSLANARYRKAGSSPCHLPWEARLRIAKGVARGLSFLHDKKLVHGNLKPSNILLGSDMEPRIGDFGLERLMTGDTSYKGGGSAQNFGSNRSIASRDSIQDFGLGPSPSPSPSSIGGLSPYHAPESLRSLKPNPKWDVYAFGVILLELLTGKVVVVDELGQGSNGLVVEDKNRAMRMADVVIRADVEGKEDALLACFKLGYSCALHAPQKRPTMKEALQVIERFPSSAAPYP